MNIQTKQIRWSAPPVAAGGAPYPDKKELS